MLWSATMFSIFAIVIAALVGSVAPSGEPECWQVSAVTADGEVSALGACAYVAGHEWNPDTGAWEPVEA